MLHAIVSMHPECDLVNNMVNMEHNEQLRQTPSNY